MQLDKKNAYRKFATELKIFFVGRTFIAVITRTLTSELIVCV